MEKRLIKFVFLIKCLSNFQHPLWIEEEKVSDDCITSIRSNFVSTRKSCCIAVINDWALVLSTAKSMQLSRLPFSKSITRWSGS